MARIGLTDLHHRQNIGQGIHPDTTISFWHLDPHKTQSTHFFDRFQWKLTAFVIFGSDGGDFFLGEIAGCLAHHLMLFCYEIKHQFCVLDF